MTPYKQFHLTNENFYFAGQRFVTRLGPLLPQPYHDGALWHVADSGDLYLLQKNIFGQYELADDLCGWSNGLAPRMHLGEVQTLVNYVKEAAAGWKVGERYFPLARMCCVVWLTIYPGHFDKYSDSQAKRNALLTAFCDGVRSWNAEFPFRFVARCIALLIASCSEKAHDSFIQHCLRYMPLSFAGLLAAHGLIQKMYWQERHREVLLQGWRHQLQNPDAPYTSLISSSRAEVETSRSLIEQYLTEDDRAFLLSETRISDEDHIIALEIADMASSPGTVKHTQVFLSQLASRSNLRKASAPSVVITFNPVITD